MTSWCLVGKLEYKDGSTSGDSKAPELEAATRERLARHRISYFASFSFRFIGSCVFVHVSHFFIFSSFHFS